MFRWCCRVTHDSSIRGRPLHRSGIDACMCYPRCTREQYEALTPEQHLEIDMKLDELHDKARDSSVQAIGSMADLLIQSGIFFGAISAGALFAASTSTNPQAARYLVLATMFFICGLLCGFGVKGLSYLIPNSPEHPMMVRFRDHGRDEEFHPWFDQHSNYEKSCEFISLSGGSFFVLGLWFLLYQGLCEQLHSVRVGVAVDGAGTGIATVIANTTSNSQQQDLTLVHLDTCHSIFGVICGIATTLPVIGWIVTCNILKKRGYKPRQIPLPPENFATDCPSVAARARAAVSAVARAGAAFAAAVRTRAAPAPVQDQAAQVPILAPAQPPAAPALLQALDHRPPVQLQLTSTMPPLPCYW